MKVRAIVDHPFALTETKIPSLFENYCLSRRFWRLFIYYMQLQGLNFGAVLNAGKRHSSRAPTLFCKPRSVLSNWLHSLHAFCKNVPGE